MTDKGSGSAGQDGAEELNLIAVNYPHITSLAAEQARISFGKYRSRSFRWLILRRPEYAAWMLREQDDLVGPALKDLPHLEETILDFDDQLIVEICNEPGCSKRAVRVTACEGYPSGTEFTCALHEPTFSWCSQWGLSGYRSALCYAEISCDGRSGAYQTIIEQIARAKGFQLPEETQP